MTKDQFITVYGKEPTPRELKLAQKHKAIKLFTSEDLAKLKKIKVNNIFVRKKR